jgi:hypothetical protein
MSLVNHVFKWFRQRAGRDVPDIVLADDYRVCFGTPSGQRVLAHLIDRYYCKVYEGTDPNAALAFEARRVVVDDILYNIDVGERPEYYNLNVETSPLEQYGGSTLP